MDEEDLTILQSTITQLSNSEKTIDKFIEDNDNKTPTSIKISKQNSLISKHTDKLNEVLMKIKLKIGKAHEL